jgi:hypothetical protein
MLAARILGRVGEEREEKGKNEFAARSVGPGKLGRSSAAPVHEEAFAAESDRTETKFGEPELGGAILEIRAGISGLCELPTTWRTPWRAANSSGAR